MGKIRFRKRRQKKRIPREVPIRTMIPNMVTFLAAAGGVTSIRFSCAQNWRMAVVFILIACVLDGLDGRVARMLRATSRLGAELDSLSDFVSFGVAPGLLLYFWLMQGVYASRLAYVCRGGFWAAALFYAMCCAFRLARFNIMLDMPTQPYWKHFFMGLPAPGGACLVMMPVVWELYSGIDVPGSPWIGAASLLICGLLLGCRMPTISAKHLRIPSKWLLPILLGVLFVIAMLIAEFWLTLFLAGIVYYFTIPVCAAVFLRLKAKHERPDTSQS